MLKMSTPNDAQSGKCRLSDVQSFETTEALDVSMSHKDKSVYL